MTLATGGIGGGVFSDNITVRHVMNVKRIAWETREWKGFQAIDQSSTLGSYSRDQLEDIVRRVVKEVRSGK
jgi:hypothetical protein